MTKPSLKYLFFKRVFQSALKIYYRSIEVYGLNFIPAEGRTLLIANHQSGLADGVLVITSAPGMVRTIAKHTLWDSKIIGFIASWFGMIPIFRKQDMTPEEQASVDAHRNDKSFSAVEQALTDGEKVLMFPEGVSHDNPHILRLRSGAARILLQTEAKSNFTLGVKWLPISIDYDSKDKPGSQVHVHYHPAKTIDIYREQYERDPQAAIEALRTEMQSYLAQITVNFETWQDRSFVERLTEIWLAMSPSELFRDRQNQLLKWKRVLENTTGSQEDKHDWEQLRQKVDAVYNSLQLGGLLPREVFERQREGRKRAVAKLFSATMIWAPIILTGLIFFWVPNRLISLITKKGAGPYRDVVSTYQIVGALTFYPLWMILTVGTVGYFTNFWLTLGFFLVVTSAGLSLASAARYLRIEFLEVLNMYRYSRLEDRLDYLEGEMRIIWAHSAKLWNRALKRQAEIEERAREKSVPA